MKKPVGNAQSGIKISADWSGRRDLNPRPSPWQGDALPLSYSRWVLFEYIGTLCSGQREPLGLWPEPAADDPAAEIAAVYAALNDDNATIEWLDKACGDRASQLTDLSQFRSCV
jgi:hypothetical protein